VVKEFEEAFAPEGEVVAEHAAVGKLKGEMDREAEPVPIEPGHLGEPTRAKAQMGSLVIIKPIWC
jgi:hypothetical protein